eukprot:2678200-Pleurochrysis_carterae.AAC.1
MHRAPPLIQGKCVASNRSVQSFAKAVEMGTETDGVDKVSLGTAVGETWHVRAYASLLAQSPSTRLMVSDCARGGGCSLPKGSGQWSRCVRATAEVYSESEGNRPGSYEFSEPGLGRYPSAGSGKERWGARQERAERAAGAAERRR